MPGSQVSVFCCCEKSLWIRLVKNFCQKSASPLMIHWPHTHVPEKLITLWLTGQCAGTKLYMHQLAKITTQDITLMCQKKLITLWLTGQRAGTKLYMHQQLAVVNKHRQYHAVFVTHNSYSGLLWWAAVADYPVKQPVTVTCGWHWLSDCLGCLGGRLAEDFGRHLADHTQSGTGDGEMSRQLTGQCWTLDEVPERENTWTISKYKDQYTLQVT